MSFIKLYAKDDIEAINNIKPLLDETGVFGVLVRTDKGDTLTTYAQMSPDGKSLTFECDSWEINELGKVELWTVHNPPVVTEPVERILAWFKAAKPNPTDKDVATQLGAHFEEVAEMMYALGIINSKSEIVENISKDFYLSKSIDKNSLGGDIQMPEGWKVQLLDALCDQIVTAVGMGYMLGFDVVGALNNVIGSNHSKFVDGKPLFNENGKIVKGPDYVAPSLEQFIKG